MKNALRIMIVLLVATAVSVNVYAKKDKKDNGVEHRVTTLEEKVENLETSDADSQSRLDDLETSDADSKSRLDTLEDLGEYLLTSPTIDAADCNLPFSIDTGYGYPAFGIGRDSFPPTVGGPFSGVLTEMLPTFGCDPFEFPPAGSPTDIVSVPRGGCLFETKAVNAAAAGYGALIVINGGDPFTYEGQLRSRMAGPGGAFPIPSIMINAKDGFDIDNLFFTNGPRPMTLDGPAQFCSPINQ